MNNRASTVRFAAPIVLIAALAAASACNSPTAPDVPAGAIRVVGTVGYYTFEGGFWAVLGDDGVIYDPMNGLPPAFRRENLRVQMVVKVRNDLVGIHMAGPIVEIISIRSI